jgi:hypothetical protein
LPDGTKTWYLNDELLTQEEHERTVNAQNL